MQAMRAHLSATDFSIIVTTALRQSLLELLRHTQPFVKAIGSASAYAHVLTALDKLQGRHRHTRQEAEDAMCLVGSLVHMLLHDAAVTTSLSKHRRRKALASALQVTALAEALYLSPDEP